MSPLRRAFRALTLLLALITPAMADVSGAPLQPPAFVERQLSAIARLQTVGALVGGCTAVLIAPQAVVTALHCARAPEDMPQIVIFPGSDATRFVVTERIVHPDPGQRPPRTLEDYRTDLAILRLAAPVPEAIATPLPLAVPDGAMTLGAFGYANGLTPQRLVGHTPCTLTLLREGVLGSDCHVVSGQSGGALVQFDDAGAHLVGILVAQANGLGDVRSLAAPLDPDTWPALAAMLAAVLDVPQATQ